MQNHAPAKMIVVPMADPYDLNRFVAVQDAAGTYELALGELRRGRKMSHWMWFVFPQITGLGSSTMSRRFAISSLDEAKAYLEDPILGPRLVKCVRMVADILNKSADEIFGSVDARKLHSSMTLFMRASPAEPLFGNVIGRYFDGLPDAATDERLRRISSAAEGPSNPRMGKDLPMPPDEDGRSRWLPPGAGQHSIE